MIILWWGAFVKMVAFPTDLVAAQTEQMFESEQTNVDDLRYQRSGLMLAVANSLITFQAQTEVAAKESDTWYGQAWDSVTSTAQAGYFGSDLARAGTQEPAHDRHAAAVYPAARAAWDMGAAHRRLYRFHDPDHLFFGPGYSWARFPSQ